MNTKKIGIIALLIGLLAVISFLIFFWQNSQNYFVQIESKIEKQAEINKKIAVEYEQYLIKQQKQKEQQLANEQKEEDLAAQQKVAIEINNKVETINPEIVKNEKISFDQIDIRLSSIVNIANQKRAFIKYKNNNQSYQINQKIDDQLIVEDILTDAVILNYQNENHKLMINTNPLEQTQLNKNNDLILKDQDKEKIQQIQKIFAKNPSSLINIIQLRLYSQNGVSGYRLFPAVDRKLFFQLGFKPNDVLLSINGFDVSERDNSTVLYNSLINETKFNIKVLRNNQLFHYQLNLN